MNCFGQSDAEASKILGRKGYDMLYELKMPMEEVYTVFKNALAKGGNASEYLIFAPMTATIADQFSKGKISKDEARDQYVKLTDAVDYNIANPSDPKYKTYYVSAKDAMTAQIAAVENQIFDCAYFKDKYAPVFEKYRDSFDRVKEIYVKLRTQGCAEDDAFVVKVKTRYDEMAVVIMESQKEEFYKANPAAHAKDLAEEGKYGEAVNKYEEAIGKETDNEKKAVYAYQIAVLQRKRGSLSAARESARTAAKYKPGWGMPWLLIGDMYSSSASDFGDPLQRSLVYLAAIEKYQYARSIDGEVADECSRRISQASRGLLPKEDFFMRGLKEGASATAPGWIGESVKMKYAN
jgi:tetratricopeptide (TPR) repeat protein